MAFDFFKKRKIQEDEDNSPEFIEIDLEKTQSESKVFVKTFVLRTYEDVNPILNALRGGITITIIDIKPLKSRDVVELKRAISKIRKTIEAVEGNIAGFGENMVIATPAFAHLQKGIQQQEKKSEIERF